MCVTIGVTWGPLGDRRSQVETQAADKERELVEILERNKLYEAGQFGLAEAVGEIKAVKTQLLVKERQIEQFCQEVNKANYALEEIRFENGHLRTKLGIPLSEQLDVEGYKRQKAALDEEERAINIVLQKEVGDLEILCMWDCVAIGNGCCYARD